MNKEKDLRTVATFCVVFCLIGFWFYHSKQAEWAWWMSVLATALLAASLLSDHVAHWLAKAWMTFGMALGWVNSRIILGLVFIVVLTPVSLLYRLVKGDVLKLKRPKGDSVYVDRNKKYSFSDLEKPW